MSVYPTPTRAAGWFENASCRGMDPDIFYGDTRAQTREAKKVCAGCPGQDACLSWAVDTFQEFGVWGGMTSRQRSKWAAGSGRRNLTPIRHGTHLGYATHLRRGERACQACSEARNAYEVERRERRRKGGSDDELEQEVADAVTRMDVYAYRPVKHRETLRCIPEHHVTTVADPGGGPRTRLKAS